MNVFFFLWWSGFEPRTLHILCIVLPTELGSRGQSNECLYIVTEEVFDILNAGLNEQFLKSIKHKL
jgi:hypothetical protein